MTTTRNLTEQLRESVSAEERKARALKEPALSRQSILFCRKRKKNYGKRFVGEVRIDGQ